MGSQPRNIVFVLTDQERYFGDYPDELEVPARRWLMEQGVTFANHYIASTYCTSSRSVIYTGQHMPNTGMFDNANFEFVGSMSPRIPTVGTMLRDAGYYTAYKGKWHLASELDPDPEQDHDFSGDMERYGFSDWNPTGDVIGNPWDGFVRDNGTMVAAIEWLRAKGLKLRAEGTPWFLSVDLVNPHDIMYFNTDLPGEKVQDPGGLLFRLHEHQKHPHTLRVTRMLCLTASPRRSTRKVGRLRIRSSRTSWRLPWAGSLPGRTGGNVSTTTTSTA